MSNLEAHQYALQKFRHYLVGEHFKMYTDHSTLKYLVNKLVLGLGGVLILYMVTAISGV